MIMTHQLHVSIRINNIDRSGDPFQLFTIVAGSAGSFPNKSCRKLIKINESTTNTSRMEDRKLTGRLLESVT